MRSWVMTSIPVITKAQALAAFKGNQSSFARFMGYHRQAIHKLSDGPLAPNYVFELITRMPETFATK